MAAHNEISTARGAGPRDECCPAGVEGISVRTEEEKGLRLLVKAQEQRLRAQGYRPRPALKKLGANAAHRAQAARTAALQPQMQGGSLAALMAFGAPWPLRARMLGNPQLMAQLFARRPA